MTNPAPPPALDPGPVTRFDGLAVDTPPRAIHPRPRVLSNPFLRILLFLVLMTAAGFALGLVVGLVKGAQLAPMSPANALITITSTVAAYAVLALLVEARRPPAELALGRLPVGLAAGLAIGAALFTVSFLAIWALGGFRVSGVGAPDWSTWWVTVLFVGASAGIAEELIFRGVGYRIVEEFLGTWAAVVLSGLVFGAVHLGNPDATVVGALGIGIAGFVFALLYATTRNLWFMMGFHAAWNVVQGPVLGVIVSGTGAANGFLRTAPAGHDLLSGGRFGAEGSVVTAVICLAAAVWLGVRVVRRRQVVAPMWTRRARQKQALAAGRTPDAASLDAKQRRALDSVAGGRLEAVGQQDAALDGQRHAGDPRGVVGGQEQQRIGDV